MNNSAKCGPFTTIGSWNQFSGRNKEVKEHSLRFWGLRNGQFSVHSCTETNTTKSTWEPCSYVLLIQLSNFEGILTNLTTAWNLSNSFHQLIWNWERSSRREREVIFVDKNAILADISRLRSKEEGWKRKGTDRKTVTRVQRIVGA